MIRLSEIQCRVNGDFVNKNVIRKNIVNHAFVSTDNGVHYAHANTALILVILMLFPALAQADLKNVATSSNINQTITLNLSQSISNISEPVVTIPIQPDSKEATVIACSNNTSLCVQYQPAGNYIGLESFNYTVVNDLDITEIATITINVGNATISDQGNSPLRCHKQNVSRYLSGSR